MTPQRNPYRAAARRIEWQESRALWAASRVLHLDRHICSSHPIDEETAALLLPDCDPIVRERAIAMANFLAHDPFVGLV